MMTKHLVNVTFMVTVEIDDQNLIDVGIKPTKKNIEEFGWDEALFGVKSGTEAPYYSETEILKSYHESVKKVRRGISHY